MPRYEKHIPLYIVWFLSGFAALSYEISWTRQVGLVFGFTVESAGTVLAAFFGGMAVGYACGAKWAPAVKKPLRVYGYLELGIALSAGLAPLLLTTIGSEYVVAALHGVGPTLRPVAKALFCFTVFLPATLCMGATLPFMARVAEQLPARQVLGTPLAYAVNTAGAVVGSLVATFILFRTVGVYHTATVGVGLSLVCGLAAIAFAEDHSPPDYGKQQSGDPRFYLWAIASGFCALGMQILFTRLFALVFHNSIYSFGIIVMVSLLAIVIGSAVVARYGQGIKAHHIALTAEVAAIITIVTVTGFLLFTELAYFTSGSTFWSYILGAFALVVLIVLPTSTLLSAMLPALWRLAADRHGWAEASGRLSCLNAVGCAFGAGATSFVLLPMLGLFGSVAALCGLLVFLSGCLRPDRRSHWPIYVSAMLLIFSFWRFASSLQGTSGNEVVLESWESAYGWIDVVEFETGDRQLRQNIHYGMGSTGSARMERAQADLPLLLHPSPQRILFAGLATGITAGAALQHREVEQIRVVELISDVVKGATYFSRDNAGILESERAEIIVNDASHFLKQDSKQYDVVIGDLFVPWESHTGYLYSQEHFALVRSRLAKGGLFCQWLPMWQVSDEEFQIIANTFASVWPHTTIWFGNVDRQWAIVGLIGSAEPLEIDSSALELKLAQLKEDKKRKSNFRMPLDIWRHYVGDWAFDPTLPINREDLPIIELDAPVSTWTPKSRLKNSVLYKFHREQLTSLPRQHVVAKQWMIRPDRNQILYWQQGQLRR